MPRRRSPRSPAAVVLRQAGSWSPTTRFVVDLPVGYVFNWLANRDATRSWIAICIVEFSSGIVLDARSGREIRREVRDPRAEAVLDRIAREVTLNPMPTPAAFATPPSGTPAPVVRGIPISPPATGDAGLER